MFQPRPIDLLRESVRTKLPWGQARVALALLVDGPAFEPPEPPVAVPIIAAALNLSPNTVKTHLRRIRRGHPELWAEIVAERGQRFARWHADVLQRRRTRSRLWGKRRWAQRVRRETGRWPWEHHLYTNRSIDV